MARSGCMSPQARQRPTRPPGSSSYMELREAGQFFGGWMWRGWKTRSPAGGAVGFLSGADGACRRTFRTRARRRAGVAGEEAALDVAVTPQVVDESAGGVPDAGADAVPAGHGAGTDESRALGERLGVDHAVAHRDGREQGDRHTAPPGRSARARWCWRSSWASAASGRRSCSALARSWGRPESMEARTSSRVASRPSANQ
jgi:hypothetical protein